MRVKLDRTICQGHGVCEMLAPQVYKVSDEDGFGEALMREVPLALQEPARQGMLNCPERAITITED